MSDSKFAMEVALRLAQAGEGATFPNPCVGAVLMRHNTLLASARTANGGRPHAETQIIALARAQNILLNQDCILYVTLEPCTHYGETPPCIETIIASGIGSLVIGELDQDQRVSGASVQALLDAGITVGYENLSGRISQFYQGYLSQRSGGFPKVALKIATSLDGKISLGIHGNWQSQWITGMLTRRRGHLLRARADAVLTGGATILADNPKLDCRISGFKAYQPLRVVVAGEVKIASDAKILTSGKSLIVFNNPKYYQYYQNIVAKNSEISLYFQENSASQSQDNCKIDLPDLLAFLSRLGIANLLVEAGNALNTAFLQENLVQRIYWFVNNAVIGNDGKAAFGDLGLQQLTDSLRFKLEQQIISGEDWLNIWDAIKTTSKK